MTVRNVGFVPGFPGPDFVGMRERFADLQRQIASGRKAETYGGLGEDRTLSLDQRANLSLIEGFQQTVTIIDTRVRLLDGSLDGVEKLAGLVRQNIRPDDFVLVNGQTKAQISARAGFDQAVGFLNADIGGRFLFGGRNIDSPPVIESAAILGGQGGRAGFQTVLRERLQADMGSSSTSPERDQTATGRLTLSAPATQPITLGEDGVHPFGMKIDTVTGAVGGTTVALAGTPPETLTIGLGAGNAQVGESLSIRFRLPDGSSKAIELKAAAPEKLTLSRDEFRIGATASETLNNLRDTLGGELRRVINTSLAGASANRAGDDFFFGETDPSALAGPPPVEPGVARRLVPGGSGGFADATGYDTPQNADNRTVRWYVGDRAAADPRATAVAKIDRTMTVTYGARADESGLSSTLKALAVGSAFSFDVNDTTARERYAEVADRVRMALSPDGGFASVTTMRVELAATSSALASAKDRHQRSASMLGNMIQDAEGVRDEVVAAQMLALQTRLQASYQTTSMISRLSLVEYMR